MTKRILVIGGTGFIGSNLARYFQRHGEDIYIVSRGIDNFWRIKDIMDTLSFLKCDLLSFKEVEKILNEVKPDVVINSSGTVRGFRLDDQNNVVDQNLIATINLTNAFVKSEAEVFINSGTAYEYGSIKGVIDESSNGHPIGLYGITKKASSEYVYNVAKKYQKKMFTARIFTPFGPLDTGNRLIPYVIASTIKGTRVKIMQPTSIRDFIYIDDVSRAFDTIIKASKDMPYGEIINVGTGIPTSIRDLVELIQSIMGEKTAVDYEEIINQDDATSLCARNDRLKSLGWRNEKSLKEGLINTINWFHEFYDSQQNKMKNSINFSGDKK